MDQAFIAAICVGIVEALKQAGMPPNWAPLASGVAGVVVGLLGGIIAGHGGAALLLDLMIGLATGLGGSGVYAVAAKVGGRAG